MLTLAQLEKIRDHLSGYYSTVDNLLYHHYSKKALQEELEEIADSQFAIEQAIDDMTSDPEPPKVVNGCHTCGYDEGEECGATSEEIDKWLNIEENWDSDEGGRPKNPTVSCPSWKPDF